MSLVIRLLGRPEIAQDGRPSALRGHKPWALLAYLLLASLSPD